MTNSRMEKVNAFFLERKFYFLIICLLLLFLRRPMEFLHPYVWNEDGTWNIQHYLNFGFQSIFHQVQGYLIIPSKLITIISLKLSFLFYPEISMLLSVLFSIFCLSMVAFAPTELKYKVFSAFAILLIPSDPEVFVLPLYSFWWGTLLLFLSLLWNQEGRSQYLRIFFTFLGSFSSPVVIICAPLFVFRAYLYRNYFERINLSIAFAGSLIQGYLVYSSVRSESNGLMDLVIDIPIILSKFVGKYFIRSIATEPGLILAFIVLVFLTYVSIKKRKELSYGFLTLIYLLVASWFLSAQRVPAEIIDPYYGGPRYFFFPYIVFSWILIWLSYTYAGNVLIRNILIGLILVALLNSASKFTKLSESPVWRTQIDYCLSQMQFDLPINFSGVRQNVWHLPIGRKQCGYLIQQSILDSAFFPMKNSTQFEECSFSIANQESSKMYLLEPKEGSWRFGHLPVQGNEGRSDFMLNSWVNADSHVGTHKLEFISTAEASLIAYMTGPVPNNQKISIRESASGKVILETSLPKADSLSYFEITTVVGQRYEVKLSDNGKAWGEWSAIYIPKELYGCQLDSFSTTGWHVGGISPQPSETKFNHFVGSWSDKKGDAFVGSHQFVFAANNKISMVEYITGPVANNQNITVRELASQKIILKTQLELAEHKVKRLMFETQVGARYGVLMSDDGDRWGEWSAIYVPKNQIDENEGGN